MNPGHETTEYKLAKWLGIVGMALQPMAAGLAAAMPDSKLVACVVAIVGAVVAIAGALGYQIPRVGLKREVLRSEAARAIAAVPVFDGEEEKKTP